MEETLTNNQEMFETLKTQLQEVEAEQKREAADIQKKMLALEQSFPSYEALQNARSEEQQAKKVWEDLGKASEESFHKKKAGIAALKEQQKRQEQVVEQTKKNWEQTSLSASESAKHYEHMYEAFLKEQAGILAENLSAGCPCPVCGSTVHPDPAKLPDHAVTELEVEQAKRQGLLRKKSAIWRMLLLRQRKQKNRSLRRQSRKRKLILYWHRRLQNSREKKQSKTMSVCRK